MASPAARPATPASATSAAAAAVPAPEPFAALYRALSAPPAISALGGPAPGPDLPEISAVLLGVLGAALVGATEEAVLAPFGGYATALAHAVFGFLLAVFVATRCAPKAPLAAHVKGALGLVAVVAALRNPLYAAFGWNAGWRGWPVAAFGVGGTVVALRS